MPSFAPTSLMSLSVCSHSCRVGDALLKSPFGIMEKCLAAANRLRVPSTLETWRWGLQEMVAIGSTAWPSRIPAVQSIFAGNVRWIPLTACTMIEVTTGGSVHRIIDRITGTVVAGAWVCICFLCVGNPTSIPQSRHNWPTLTTLWLLGSFGGFVAGYSVFKWPKHMYSGLTIAQTTPILLGSGLTLQQPLFVCIIRALCVLLGVLVSGFVALFLFPRRAHVDLSSGLAQILEHLATALDPLIHTTAAHPELHKMETPKPETDTSPTQSDAVREHVLSQETEAKATHQQFPTIFDPEPWIKFKPQIDEGLKKCAKLLSAQVGLAEAAKNECSLNRSGRLIRAIHLEALIHVRTLFYHVMALFTTVSTQLETLDLDEANKESDEIIKEILCWSGVDSLQNRQKRLWTSSPWDYYYGDFLQTKRWSEVYEPLLSKATHHICDALMDMSRALKEGIMPRTSRESLNAAEGFLRSFQSMRITKKHTMSICVDWLMDDSERDIETIQANMSQALGTSVNAYRSLTPNGRDLFWERHWILSDKLSTAKVSIETLFVCSGAALEAIENLQRVVVAANRQSSK